MKSSLLKNINNQHLLIFLFLLCSAMIRFHDLGSIPLNDSEASLALSALNLAKGDFSNLAPHPLYLAFTSLFFQFFSANNITARFFPALIGSVFPLLPLLFRKWVGSAFALLMSILLIFDPVLVSLSRQADSRMLAMFFFVLMAAFLLQEKFVFAGIAAGLFFLSGSFTWYLIAVMVISFVIYAKITKFQKNRRGVIASIKNNVKKRNSFIISALICVILIGTGFMRQPQLINSVIQSLIDFSEGWFKGGSFLNKSLILLVGFIASYLLFIFFLLIGLINKNGRYSHIEKTFLIYGAISFFFLIGYPATSLIDILIFLPFFYFFVCKGILKWWLIIQKNRKESMLIGTPIIGLVGFIWLAVLRILNLPLGSIEYAQMLVAIIGSVFLIGLMLLLIGWGWSLKIALSGFSFGFFTILFLFQASVNFHSFSPSRRPETEIWWASTYVEDSNILMNTVEEVSLWNTGIRNGLDIQITGVDLPSLRWQLRDHNVILSNVLHPDNLSPVVVTKTNDNPLLEDSYRGQKVPYFSELNWIQNIPMSLVTVDFYRWLFFRDSMIKQDNLFIWMRADLFVGNNIKFESRVF